MVLSALKEIISEEQIQISDELHPLGNNARYTVFPKSEEEIAAILKIANERSFKVIPMGGGTKRGFGGLEETSDILLSLTQFKGIIEHSVDDMTVTIRSGTTIKEIVDYLSEHKQMIPVDPSWPEYSTIGGIVVVNDSGPKRLRYGAARDFVLGLRVVYPDGRIIRSGGKTVKNVAGYDMNKLFIGSMGTLGVVSAITVKLRPLPKYESLVLLTFPTVEIETIRSFVTTMLDSVLEPVSLELLNPTLTNKLIGKNGYSLAIAFEDLEKSVHYQEEWVKSHQPRGTEIEILPQQEAKDWWSNFAEIAPKSTSAKEISKSEIEIALKIGSKNIDVIDHVETCHRLGLAKNIIVEAHGGSGHGISRVYVKGSPDKLLPYVDMIRSSVEEKGGYVVVQHLPLVLRRQLSVWGEKPSYFSLLEGIKRTFDPNMVLNHKRFVGGL